jgi:hypothetical protein
MCVEKMNVFLPYRNRTLCGAVTSTDLYLHVRYLMKHVQLIKDRFIVCASIAAAVYGNCPSNNQLF